MFDKGQEHIDISGTNGKVIGGDDYSTTNNFHSKNTKLSKLFDRLDIEYNSKKEIDKINDDLQRYMDNRDSIGLEQKLINGSKEYLLDDAIWLKQEYSKKLTRFQFFEPAQDIHAFLLGIVLEKFRNIIYPLIRANASDVEIMTTISQSIVTPIINIITEEGCNDVMGLSATDIDGMIYFLTGRCHIKWES